MIVTILQKTVTKLPSATLYARTAYYKSVDSPRNPKYKVVSSTKTYTDLNSLVCKTWSESMFNPNGFFKVIFNEHSISKI